MLKNTGSKPRYQGFPLMPLLSEPINYDIVDACA